MSAKKTEKTAGVGATVQSSYTKEKLVASKKYSEFKDYLQGNLEDGKSYTFEEVDDILKIMKGIGD